MEKLKKSKVSLLTEKTEATNVYGFSNCGCGKTSSGSASTTTSATSTTVKCGIVATGDNSGGVKTDDKNKPGDYLPIGSCGVKICGETNGGVTVNACGTTGTSGGTGVKPQIPDDPNKPHCDILAYNKALENGYNAGNWNGNNLTVNDIYNKNYRERANDFMTGDAGYGFVDFGNDSQYDHMFFYEKTQNGYRIWDSNGVSSLLPYSDSILNGYYKNARVNFVQLDKIK